MLARIISGDANERPSMRCATTVWPDSALMQVDGDESKMNHNQISRVHGVARNQMKGLVQQSQDATAYEVLRTDNS